MFERGEVGVDEGPGVAVVGVSDEVRSFLERTSLKIGRGRRKSAKETRRAK